VISGQAVPEVEVTPVSAHVGTGSQQSS
jgi:hypothetical protein